MTFHKTGQTVCHIKVAEVAKKVAGELYENTMSNDYYWALWQEQNPDADRKELERRFIERNWPKCLEYARTSMALMLRDPALPDKVKEEIVEILALDQSVRGKRFQAGA